MDSTKPIDWLVSLELHSCYFSFTFSRVAQLVVSLSNSNCQSAPSVGISLKSHSQCELFFLFIIRIHVRCNQQPVWNVECVCSMPQIVEYLDIQIELNGKSIISTKFYHFDFIWGWFEISFRIFHLLFRRIWIAMGMLSEFSIRTLLIICRTSEPEE